jgi:hypothetical protein
MSDELPPEDPQRPPHVPERFERTQGRRLGDALRPGGVGDLS